MSAACGPQSRPACWSWCCHTRAPSCSPTAGVCVSGWRSASTSWRKRRWCARTTARWRGRSASRSRALSSAASCGGSWPPARWSWASTWAPWIWWCRSSRPVASRAGCSASGAPATRWGAARRGASSPSFAATCWRRRWSRAACSTATSSPSGCPTARSTCWRSSWWRPAPRSSGRSTRWRRWCGAPGLTWSYRARCCWACSTCWRGAIRRTSWPICARA